MKLEVYSFDSLTYRARKPFPARTTLISIGDPDTDPPELRYRPDAMLRLEFDDITEELIKSWLDLGDLSGEDLDAALEAHNTYLFSPDMARRAARFIREHINSTSLFVCQCQFGQSRSAAVAAAIAEYFFGRGDVIFSNPKYGPNPLVYSRLLDALRNPE